MPAQLVVVVLLGLTTYRLTRLVTRDQFPPVLAARNRVERWAAGNLAHREWAADLVTCHWCASGWIAITLTALWLLAPQVALPVLLAGSAWAVGALLAQLEPEK